MIDELASVLKAQIEINTREQRNLDVVEKELSGSVKERIENEEEEAQVLRQQLGPELRPPMLQGDKFRRAAKIEWDLRRSEAEVLGIKLRIAEAEARKARSRHNSEMVRTETMMAGRDQEYIWWVRDGSPGYYDVDEE